VNISFLLPIILLFIVLWLFMIRPQRRRAQAQSQMQDHLRIGDEIITAGGLHATVVSIEDDVLEIEVAKNTVARLDRRAVQAIVPREEPEPEAEPEPELEPKSKEVAEEPVASDDG
jgi:preprotein translocase subunit YajC